jgi:hypothetical protein
MSRGHKGDTDMDELQQRLERVTRARRHLEELEELERELDRLLEQQRAAR